MSSHDRGRAKSAIRAVVTSDVARVRTLGLAALGAAAGVSCALASGATTIGSSRVVAQPHAAAKVPCVSCHAEDRAASKTKDGERRDPFEARAACTSCHGASEHVSTRSGHRALAARGELTCATCHPAHDGAQGVTIGGDGRGVRWGAVSVDAVPIAQPPNATVEHRKTVPLVALSACAHCHDPSRASDPVSSCVPADVRRDPAMNGRLSATPSVCFDEHRTLASAGDRFVAWEIAREVAVTTPWVSRSSESGSAVPARGMREGLPLVGGLAGALMLGGSATLLERRRRAKSSSAPLKTLAPPSRRKLPVIDPSTCLGCYACVDACPFDVLTIERYVAVVARPEECCGVVLCAQVCPNGSLRIDEGEAVTGMPTVDEHLESVDVPGLFVAGDLTGLPLIKNAIHQGVRAIDRIAATLPRTDRAPIDVLVIGAGPAGLSAALRAQEKGLTCVVLEQATVAASIKSFPRDKIVYDPPLDLPVVGELWLREASKEELVAQWTRIVRARSVDVREGQRVTDIARSESGFVVTTSVGDASESFRAPRVVLAIGKRGTPKPLDAADVTLEPGAEAKISFSLADARSLAGKRVLVVGLGDSAMEAAIAIARQPGTTVSVSYRGTGFRRGKAKNVAELRALVDRGVVRLLLETTVKRVTKTSVTLGPATPPSSSSEVRAAESRTIPNDIVLVLIGGVPSWDLLTRAGIRRAGSS